MGGAGNMRQKIHGKFWLQKLNRRDQAGDVHINERRVKKWILKKQCVWI